MSQTAPQCAHVLVVDDDQAIRETVRLALEDAGYSVSEATDGQNALDTLREASGQYIVLLDHLMPHLDGLSVLQAVTQSDELTHQAHGYVLVTANPQVIASASRGTLFPLRLDVLEKPFDIDALLGIVERVAHRLQQP